MIALPATEELLALLQTAEQGPIAPEQLQWLAPLIDHTLLKPGATEEQHRQLCEEARRFHFATVCVYPAWIPFCRKLLEGSGVLPIAVVGFPTGLDATVEKIAATEQAVAAGAEEIDMVLQVEKLKARKHRSVYLDIRKVVRAAGHAPVKVILETCLLTQEEKLMACALAKAAGAAFVKTSTGFSHSGATVSDVRLLRGAVGPGYGVKASGGVRLLPDALSMILAGANRLGTSSGVSLVSGNSTGKQTGVY